VTGVDLAFGLDKTILSWTWSLRRERMQARDPRRAEIVARRWARRWARRHGALLGPLRVSFGEVGNDFLRNRATLLVKAEIRAVTTSVTVSLPNR
jgi:hypothetical protein